MLKANEERLFAFEHSVHFGPPTVYSFLRDGCKPTVFWVDVSFFHICVFASDTRFTSH